ncbi:hypothetical protein [Rickettsiella endosymbiont of Rhagonycha lignosa]|uniref:hypothetical protein n=1 Tax=Rickettsiella endosymbiont of Rhagonycha lignosa TaxID=3077937 RepID=UPI00313F11CF
MFENDLTINEELLLRRHAAKGELEKVQDILNRNKINPNFNINAQSSNGNTALHWACSKAVENANGYSKEYSKIVQLLIQDDADHRIKNKLGQIPLDFLQGLHVTVPGPEGSSHKGSTENSCYFEFISALLRKECVKITLPEELEGELAGETAFYFIIDSLKLADFLPPDEQQETVTILSLACGISTEILPLMLYFQYQNKKINYVGVDNNDAIIEDNKKRYAAYENIQFICADAANLDEITTQIVPNSIDMGILRNGDFTELRNRQNIFCQIIDEIFPNVLKPNFPLLVSFQTKQELEICTQKTQIIQNFKKFKGNNFCDIGSLCLISGQYQNKTVFSYSDRYTAILNLEKINEQEQMQIRQFSK